MKRYIVILLAILGLSGFYSEISSQQLVNIQVYYGGYGSECSWEIQNSLTGTVVLSGGPGNSNSFSFNSPIIFNPGEYNFIANDTEGDGWSDPAGHYSISPNLGLGTGLVYFPDGYTQSTSFTILSSNTTEIGVVAWLSPLSGAGLSANQSVIIKYKNYGTAAISNVSFSYSVNGGTSFVSEIFTGSVLPGQTIDYTFNQTANFQTPGSYSCIAAANKAGDTFSGNDSLSITITSVSAITNFPYTQNFSSWPPQNWQLSGGTHQWASYQNQSAFCNFSFWPQGNAYLTSPHLNLTGPATLKFQWSSYFSSIALNDELVLQVSNNNGSSWESIWSKTGMELYSNDGVSILNPGSFVEEVLDLSAYTGNIIQLRFHGISGYGHNVYIDNVSVLLNPAHDLAIIELISPNNFSCNLGEEVPITLRVKNLGANMASNFTVTYTINGGNPVSQVYTSFLPSSATFDFTFTNTVDFSSLPNANMSFNIVYGLDQNLLNNSLINVDVNNSLSINTFPFFIDFESNATSYFSLEANEHALVSIQAEGTNNSLRFEGGSVPQLWIGAANTTTELEAWEINTPYQASAYTCLIDATDLNSVELFFDLKQRFRSGNKNSWFRVLVNGNPISDVLGTTNFNPNTSVNDSYVNKHFDLSQFAGSEFTLEFQTSNKFSTAYSFPGDVAFVDNVLIREIPPPDIALIEILNPVTTCGLSANEDVTLVIANLGGTLVEEFLITVEIDGVSEIEYEFIGSILPDDTITLVLPQTLDLSVIASYGLLIHLNLIGDSNLPNNSISVTITNHQTPSPTFTGLNTELCLYEQPVTLNASPAGGVFSGLGVAGETFYALEAGPGEQIISYTYTDELINCQTTISDTINIIGDYVSFTGLDLNPDLIDVLVVVNYNSGWPTQQSWTITDNVGNIVLQSGTGNLNGFIYNDNIQLPVGEYYFTAYDVPGDGWNNSYYEITPAIGAGTGLQNFFLFPYQIPVYSKVDTFQVGIPTEYCASDTNIALTGIPTGGVFSGPGISQNLFNPSIAGSGVHQITYTYESESCIGSYTEEVVVLETPQAFLGSDMTVCNVADVALAPIAGPQNGSYLWSNGSTQDTLVVTANGSYSLTITGENGCYTSDTIQILFISSINLDIGDEYLLCEGESLLLEAPSGYDSYLWSNAETTLSIQVSSPGYYSVTVGSGSCVEVDTAFVDFYLPQSGLDEMYQVCLGSAILIEANLNLDNYLWSNGHTGSSVQLFIPGNYSLTITDTNQCQAISNFDLIGVNLPSINLGPDLLLEDTAIILNIGTAYNSILWSTGATSSFILIDTDDLGQGVFEFWVEVSNQSGCVNSDTLIVSVEVSTLTHSIQLSSGWSMFSTYISPSYPQIVTMMSDILPSLIIVKNSSGNVYWPGFGFDGIGTYNSLEGYQILLNQADILDITGNLIQPELTPISLPLNWSLISYLRTTAAPIDILLTPILNDFVIIKNGAGQVFWPGLNFNGIGNMMPGYGYQILIQNQTILTYPANSISFKNNINFNPVQSSSFNSILPSGNSMTIGLMNFVLNAPELFPIEIGVFNNRNQLVGKGFINDPEDSYAITIWGIDETQDMENRMILSESFKLKVYSERSRILYDVDEIKFLEGDGLYKHNDIQIIQTIALDKKNHSKNLELTIYPNPTLDNPTTIDFYNPYQSNVTIQLYNTDGSLLETMFNQHLSKGLHQHVFNFSNYSAGSYLILISAGNQKVIKSLIKN